MSKSSIAMPLLEDTKIDKLESEEQGNLSEVEESDAALVLPQTDISQTDELRRSERIRKPTAKMLENLEQEAALKGKKFTRMYDKWKLYIKDVRRRLKQESIKGNLSDIVETKNLSQSLWQRMSICGHPRHLPRIL